MAAQPSSRSALFRTLLGAEIPIVLLDAKGTIVFANTAVAAKLNVDVDTLVGQSAHYGFSATGDSAAHAASLIAPPPELYQEDPLDVLVSVATTANSDVRLRYHVLRDGTGALLGAIGLGVGGTLSEGHASAPANESRKLHRWLGLLRSQLKREYDVASLVGCSDAVRRLRRQIRIAAHSNANLLIVGPLGSGREHLARTIHRMTNEDRNTPLITLDCSLLDGELLQNTITGALQQCAELEVSTVPTLLLLDVDRLDRNAQHDLYDILAIEQLAIRTLATAQHRLDTVVDPPFDFGLMERLTEIEIAIPRLEERRQDIGLLLQYFIEGWNDESTRVFSGFAPDALDVLSTADWPGQIQELRDTARKCWESAHPPRIQVGDLPERFRLRADPQLARLTKPSIPKLDEALESLERSLLTQSLRRAKGNRARAARLLGISRARFLRRLSQFDITE